MSRGTRGLPSWRQRVQGRLKVSSGADLRSKNIFISQFEEILFFVHITIPCPALRFSGGQPSAPDTDTKHMRKTTYSNTSQHVDVVGRKFTLTAGDLWKTLKGNTIHWNPEKTVLTKGRQEKGETSLNFPS